MTVAVRSSTNGRRSAAFHAAWDADGQLTSPEPRDEFALDDPGALALTWADDTLRRAGAQISPAPSRRDRVLPPAWRGPSRAAVWRRARARRLLAATLVGFGAWSALTVLAPSTPDTGRPVVIASADLPAGHVLEASDVTLRQLPADAVPSSALQDPAQAVGRPLTGPVAAGESLTPARLRTAGLLHGLGPGERAVHLTIADQASLPSISAGDRVDVVTRGGDVVARDVLVLGADPVSAEGNTGLFSPSGGAGVTVALRTGEVGAVLGGTVNDTPGAGVHLAVRPPGARYSNGGSADLAG